MQVQELVGIVPWNFIATICNLFYSGISDQTFPLQADQRDAGQA